MHGDGWTLILGVGTILASIVAVAVLSLRRSGAPSATFAALIGCFALILAEELVDNAGWQSRWPHFSGVTMGFELLIGPLLFLHIRSLTSPDRRLRAADAFHFIPFALATLWLIPFYALAAEAKLALVRGDLPAQLKMVVLFKAIHCSLYLVISLWLLRPRGPRHRSPIVVWYRSWVVVLLAIGAASYGLHEMAQRGWSLPIDSDRFAGLTLTIFLCSTTFFAFRRSLGTVRVGDPKYRTSPLTRKTQKLQLKRLVAHLEQERPYRDSELRLESLARALGLPEHHLTQILSESLGTTYYELVNRWRVEDVKAALTRAENRQRSLLDLAFDAGFNSKATFNRSFKKLTGLTPSQYRKQVQEQQISSQSSE